MGMLRIMHSGGGGSTSDLPWDGRRPDEEEEVYRRRCLSYAVQVVHNNQKKFVHRKTTGLLPFINRLELFFTHYTFHVFLFAK